MSFPDTPLQGSVDSIGWGIAQQNGRARRAERVHPIVQHEGFHYVELLTCLQMTQDAKKLPMQQ